MHVACQIEADSCEIVSGVVGKIWKSNLQNSLLTHGIEKFATSKVVNRNYIYNTADSGSSFSERRLLQTTRVPPQRTSVTFVKYFQKLIYSENKMLSLKKNLSSIAHQRGSCGSSQYNYLCSLSSVTIFGIWLYNNGEGSFKYYKSIFYINHLKIIENASCCTVV